MTKQIVRIFVSFYSIKVPFNLFMCLELVLESYYATIQNVRTFVLVILNRRSVLTFYVFASCFRSLAVIFISDWGQASIKGRSRVRLKELSFTG